MLTIILRVLKAVFFLFLMVVGCAAFMQAMGFIKAQWKPAIQGWFGVGLATYAAAYVLFFRGRIDIIETFEHEMAHSVAAFLSFKNINFFAVHSSGAGMVELKSKINAFIALAPYFLPIFMIPFLVVKPFVSVESLEYVDFFTGLTLGFFYMRLLKEFRPYQTDLDVLGFHLSTAIIILLNVTLLVVVLSLVLSAPEHISDFLKRTMESTRTLLAFIYEKI